MGVLILPSVVIGNKRVTSTWKVAILCLDSLYMYMVPLCSGAVHIVACTRFRIYYMLITEVNIPLNKGR